jgi:Fe-S-cluster containining protein
MPVTMQMDSVDKIITRYFSCITNEEFEYKGQVYKPKTLMVSPYLFRGFTCPAGCGACCKAYTLDYLPEPTETHPYPLETRMIHFDGRRITIYSDLNDHGGYYCHNLNQENGRCTIHGKHAFSCDFELTRFLVFDEKTPNRLTSKLYGRGHAMTRVDGTKGSMCDMLPPTQETADDVLRKLKRLRNWCEHFGLKHKLDRIIKHVSDGPRAYPISV